MRATRRMEQLNADWSKQGRPHCIFASGCIAPMCWLAMSVRVERLSYTVMGDGVNVAARLEGINKTFRHHDLHQRQRGRSGRGGHRGKTHQKVQVKGRKREFMIYELLGHQNQRRSGAEAVGRCGQTLRIDAGSLVIFRAR